LACFASRFSKSVDPEQQNREILDRLDTILSWVPRGMRDRLTGNRDATELFTLLEGREVDDVRGIGDAVETMQRREQVQASQKRVGRNAPCPCGSRKNSSIAVVTKRDGTGHVRFTPPEAETSSPPRAGGNSLRSSDARFCG
jgi:hypothetical protein